MAINMSLHIKNMHESGNTKYREVVTFEVKERMRSRADRYRSGESTIT